MQEKVFTMEDWTGSLTEHLKIGDLVDDEVVWKLMDVVPPACMRSSCMQVGEAYSTKIDDKTGEWREVYTTFKKALDEKYNGMNLYIYCGNCFYGENEERGKEIPYL